MIWIVIISGIGFILGNIAWPLFNDYKVFFVPLAIFISALLLQVKKLIPSDRVTEHLFLKYLLLLSYGNIIKQVFYTDKIKQINDYVWGALVTTWLIYKLIKLWAIRKHQLGGRR